MQEILIGRPSWKNISAPLLDSMYALRHEMFAERLQFTAHTFERFRRHRRLELRHRILQERDLADERGVMDSDGLQRTDRRRGGRGAAGAVRGC